MSYFERECQICGYDGKKIDIKKDESNETRFARCPNCGSTYYMPKGGCVNIDHPQRDYSAVGMARMFIGAIIFGIGCWQGLGQGGVLFGIVGSAIWFWGWYVRKDQIAQAKLIMNIYPYWKEKNIKVYTGYDD